MASKAISRPDEASQPVELEPGETLTIEPYVIMPEGYSVIAGKAPELQTTTDAEGEFALKGLNVRGDTRVIAALPDGSAAYAELVDASVPLAVTIELAAPVTIVATVLDADGEPVVGAIGSIRCDGRTLTGLHDTLRTDAGGLETNADGKFTADNLVAGLEYGVIAYTGEQPHPEHTWYDKVLVIGGEGVIEMTLTRRRR